MTARYSPNVPTANYDVQALCYYHWLTFCTQFTEIEAQGTWDTGSSGTDGRVESSSPSRFFTDAAFFAVGDVGKYLAIRDDAFPDNTTLAVITAFISSTEVQLNSPVVAFSDDSTDVNYRLFDTTNPPAVSSYFVIQNPITSQPQWQVRCVVRSAAPFVTSWEFAPIGGWSISGSNWTLPNVPETFMYDTIDQTFMVADPDEGWFFTWSEDVPAGDQCGCWLGTLSPLHAPGIAGNPSDTSYAAIFGSSTATKQANFVRDTPGSADIATGGLLLPDLTAGVGILANKRTFATDTDMQTVAALTVNPRSGEADDYDVVVLQVTPGNVIRGKIQGMRLMNQNIANRTLISGGGTYVIAGGLGVVWNGKTPV